jgi:WD40 repeat protein
MDAPLDYLLIDPRREELVAALTQAVLASAGLPDLGVGWGPLLDSISLHREGIRQWDRSEHDGFMYLAWWTDHQERRHHRIRGGRFRSTRGVALVAGNEDAHPPLWHVYPDRLFRRTSNGVDEWLAVCGCGVTGLPERLAWMGECCGPCCDRREEGEPVREEFSVRRRHFGVGVETISGIAFDAEGRQMLVALSPRSGRGALCLWSHDTVTDRQKRRDLGNDQTPITAMDLSPDGTWAVVAKRGSAMQMLPLTRDLPLQQEDLVDVRHLQFSPNGLMFVARSADERLQVWKQDGHRGKIVLPVWKIMLDRREVTAAALAPDSATLAVAGSDVRLHYLIGSEWREGPPIPVLIPANSEVSFLGFDATGRSLIVVASPAWNFDEVGPRRKTCWVEVWATPDPGAVPRPFTRLIPRTEIPEVSVLALSPDGCTLAWVIHDDQHSPAEVTFWDLASASELGRLEWDGRELISEMTFTPNGESLVTGTEWGTVKFWPWRLLLES